MTTDSDRVVAKFRDECPTTTSFMGDEIPHPEVVTTSCDGCGKQGHVFEGACIAAMEQDAALLCVDCEDYAFMTAVRCTECDLDRVRNLNGPEPPDPDRHGNMHIGFECRGCGERGALVTPAPGTHGPRWVDGPERFERADSDEDDA